MMSHVRCASESDVHFSGVLTDRKRADSNFARGH